MDRTIKRRTILSAVLCALLCLALFFTAQTRAHARILYESEVDSSLLGGYAQNEDTDSVDTGAQELSDASEAREDSAAVQGAYDESPGGVGTFWGVVIALFVAGAVVFGVALVIPRDDEDEA